MFDFSDCQRVPPGGNCTIRCGLDYEGKSTVAYCPSDNTDPNGQLVYLEPKCSLKPYEMRAPPGYVESPCGWECDTGYWLVVCNIFFIFPYIWRSIPN